MADNRCRILLPRALRARDRFVELLSNSDYGERFEVLRWPVMAIEPLIESNEEKRVAGDLLARSDIVIFVSATAVEMAESFVPPGQLQSKQVYAVGSATADCLAARGIAAETSAQANSEGLLRLLASMPLVNKSVVICRGQGGRETLKAGLIDQGAEVSYLNLYQRTLTLEYQNQINQAICDKSLDTIVIHSGEVFQNLLSLLTVNARTAVSRIPLLAAGERIADIVKEEGCHVPMVSATALPEDMVAELVRWYTRQ
jgi:uroporphyrinogen-III synthase